MNQCHNIGVIIFVNYERPAKVFIYDTETAQLVFVSNSVQYIADHVGIHRSTILRYTTTAELYLNRFLIS